MRLGTPAAALGALLAVSLTWLMINGTDASDPAYVETLEMTAGIAPAEAQPKHDGLGARTGLPRDHDHIVESIDRLRAAAAKLEAARPGDPDVRDVAAAVAGEAASMERSKADKARLQNLLALFDSMSDRLSDPGADPRLAQAVAALRVRMTEFAHEANTQRLDDLHERLNDLAGAYSAPDRAPEVAGIFLYGHELLDLLLYIDVIIQSLPAAHEAWQSRADWDRTALYVIALAFLTLLVWVGSLMRSRTAILRRTVAFQTVIAHSANRLLEAPPDEIPAHIVDVLGIMGEALNVDHCYVLMLGGAEEAHLWSRPGLPPPSGWPAAQRGLIPHVAACLDDTVLIETAHDLGPAALREALRARGVASWASCRLRRGGRAAGLLCFECRTAALPPWLQHSRVLLQVVTDSFGAALERRCAGAERREIEAALRRAKRLETIGTFASGVAHNFNNILNVMLGHAEIAAAALPDGTRASGQIELLMQAGGRAREIAGQILECGRQTDAGRRTCAIDAVLQETVMHLRTSMAEPLAIRLSVTAGGVLVGGEPAQLQQVALNLIRNAAQASRLGEAIDVRLDSVVLARARALSHGVLQPGEYARLRVADTGCGMEGATLARIFEPFFTTRSAGTGLGLATAFTFVREQGGAFDVCTAPSAGSVFEAWLPVVRRAEAGADAPPAGTTVMVVGRARNLIQSDEETLAALGYEPVGFADPEAALTALRAAPERFDLLIVESRLAGAAGVDFARRAAAFASVPIVLSLPASATVEPADLTSIPVADVLRRPWGAKALAPLLSRHLKRSAPGARRGQQVSPGAAAGAADPVVRIDPSPGR